MSIVLLNSVIYLDYITDFSNCQGHFLLISVYVRMSGQSDGYNINAKRKTQNAK